MIGWVSDSYSWIHHSSDVHNAIKDHNWADTRSNCVESQNKHAKCDCLAYRLVYSCMCQVSKCTGDKMSKFI